MATAEHAEPVWAVAAPAVSRDEREEAQWIARARANDPAAFRWLLERYRTRVVRLAAHVLRRDDEAEDVAQEAFLRAFRQISKFRGERGFAPWLFRIVVRLCLDRLRLSRWTAEAPALAAEALAPAEDIDTRLLIETLLDQLSPPMRAALTLRELEGLEYEEIADTLQIPVGTVRSRLNAARVQFRRLWAAAQEEDAHV